MSLATQKHTNPSEVTDFVIRYSDGLYLPMHRKAVTDTIQKHMDYGTLLTVRKQGEIVGVVRWNFISTNTIKVLDLVIHPDHRNKGVMKAMLIQGLMAFPYIKNMTFHRKKHHRDTNCLVRSFLGGR